MQLSYFRLFTIQDNTTGCIRIKLIHLQFGLVNIKDNELLFTMLHSHSMTPQPLSVMLGTSICLNGKLSHLNDHKLDRQAEASYFQRWAQPCPTSPVFLKLLCDLDRLRAKFRHKVTQYGTPESQMQLAGRCAPWKAVNNAENLYLQVPQFRSQMCAENSQTGQS